MAERRRFERSPLEDLAAVTEYLGRIDAEMIGMRRAAISVEDESGYWRDRAIIRFDLKAGSVKVTPYGLTVEEAEELDPTKEEAAAIAKAITGAELPRSMPTGVRNEPPGVDPKTLIRYQSLDGKATLFIEQRIEKDFDKVYVPWTYFTDGRWRKMEPDDGLPLYGLNKLRQSKKDIRRDGMRFRAMVHEGGSVARALWENPVEDHPWAADLRTFVHLGWAGGAHSAHRVDWRPLIQSRMSITISADNDPPGVEASGESPS